MIFKPFFNTEKRHKNQKIEYFSNYLQVAQNMLHYIKYVKYYLNNNTKNGFLQILAKKAKKSDFFLDILFKRTIICSYISKLFGFSEMFERNPLAVKSSSSTGIGNSEPSGGVAQSQITSMCATGGLTQKQSLRGLLLMHQVKNLRVRRLSTCHADRLVLW